MDPLIAKRKKVTASAATLYSRGIDAFRRRDYRAALSSFTEARRADPKYAPAWYGLGLVNESLHQNGAAKAAYQRYLTLAPSSANAAQLRAKLKQL